MSFWKQPAKSAEYLKGVAFFDGFTDEELQRIAQLSGELILGAGSVLMDQGDTGVDCYVIVDGTASVRIRDEEITTLGPGEMVGEMALVDFRPRIAKVVALTDMQLVRFNSGQFRELLKEMPKASERVMSVLGERLKAETGLDG